MNRLLHIKPEYRVAFPVLVLLCAISFGMFLFHHKSERENSLYSEQQAILETAYRASIQSYRLAMESFFDNALNTPQTLAIFAEGVDTQGPARDLARGKLYRHLYSAYISMKRQNLLHLQFYLADGTSYLRFHQPDRYGDALLANQTGVRLCNTEKRIVHGLEIGRTGSGFSYNFPLRDEGRHLGSVEVSVTFKSILDALTELAPDKEYSYLLKKKVMEAFVFPEQRWLYSPSGLNDQYVMEDAEATLPNSPAPLSATARALNNKLRAQPKVQHAMQAGGTLSMSVELAAAPYTVTLLPLDDIDQRFTGYLVTYARNPRFAQINQEFIFLLLYTLIALSLIVSLIWRLRQRTLALDEEQRNTSAMNNALAEGVYVQDIKGIISRINPAACQLLGYDAYELVGQNAHDLFHRHAGNTSCPKEDCIFFRTANQGKGYDGEEYFLRKNGMLRLMEVSSRPIFQDSAVVGAVIAFHDITRRKRTEAALRQSEEIGRRLSTAVEQSPASVVITDAQGTIEYVNQKFTQKTGYSVAEALGQNPRILKSGMMPESVYQNLWHTISAGDEWKGELQNKRKDGSLFWESISISPIRNEAGIITHFIAIKEDITDRMRIEAELRENERIQRTLIESLPIGLVIIDSESRIIEEVNSFAAAMFGAEREAIIGRRCHNFLCPTDENSCPIINLGLLVDNSDRKILRADGSEIPVLKTVRKIIIGDRIKLLECFLDIRERKQAEEDVREANRQLEAAIVRAEQLAWEADTANKAKSLFLANMSHEIRTPMNAIIGMTHLAMQTKDSTKRQRFLETVQHAAESLLGLLNDILDFSKIEAGQLQLNMTPFQPTQLLAGVLATMQMPAEEKGLHLIHHVTPDLPEWLIGDDMRLRQILLNLIGNAIKFTAAGSVEIRITLETSPSAEVAMVHCTVTDTGIGIAPDKLSLIFNSFEQADNSYVRQYGGTGLGLAICRQLMAMMGGRIWAESRMHNGSTFHFVVPLQVCAEKPSNQEPDSEPQQLPPRNLRILVVDDNEVNRDVAVMLLEQEHTVSTAINGLEALRALALANYDVVLMDVQMPVMDGLAASRIIRTLEQAQPLDIALPDDISTHLPGRLRNRHPAIVAMTAHAMDGDREMCLENGMDTYITKPFQPDQLFETLRSLHLASQPDQHHEEESPPMPHNTPHPPVASPPTVQQVIEYLHHSTMLNADQIDRILIAVRTSLTENLAKAEAAAASGDLSTLAKASHTLKGTLLQCGLNDWAEQAQAMYDGVKQGRELAFTELIAVLRAGMSQLI